LDTSTDIERSDEMSEDGKKKISLPIVGDEEGSADEASGDGGPKTRAEGGDVMSEIDREVGDHTVVLYMKGTPQQPMCGFSQRASAILQTFGRPFYSVNILEDPEKRQAIKEYSNWPTIPQVYVGGEFLGGSDILMEMYETGELADKIEEAFESN
jgi:monothiol glutaredoxin